jgi:cytochrome c
MIHGDVTHGGIKRVFAEKVNGAYQGVVFRFTQGLEAGVNRLVWGPDGALYIGGVGSTGNWGHNGKLSYGLQKLTYNKAVAFEMLAVRAKPNGVEIEFTEPLKEGAGLKASDYNVRQWFFKPTGDYGGPKLDDQAMTIKNVQVSADRKKVLLELPGMKANHVVYIRLNKKTMASSTGKNLWTTEAWYTMNSIPQH